MTERHETDVAYLERRIGGGSLKELVQFPRYFEIETVNACNAACPFCTIADWQRKPQVMKDELFEKIAAEIGEHPEVKRVHLYRDGEPLLDKKIASRIKRMKDAGVREVGISTNASLLTEEKAGALFEAGLDELILSIDSVNPPTYAKLRVGLDFKDVMANSARAFFVRNQMKATCRIRVRMIRQEANADEWKGGWFQSKWVPFCSEGDVVEYRDIHNWGGQLEGFKPIAEADTVRPCLALWSLMVIFADGSVPLCNVDYNNHYPLGNLSTYSIAEMWQSATQERRRFLHMVHQREQITPCTNCTVWAEHSKAAA